MTRPVLVMLMLAALPVTAGAQTPITRVSWLQGCWRMNVNGQTVDEEWMAPDGGAMLAISRTVKGGRLVEYEFVLLRERDGSLVYIAHPSGQVGGEFPLARVDDDSVTFENTAHDFPQRIGYRRRGDRLDAWIEGTLDGRSHRAEFPYARVPCAGK